MDGTLYPSLQEKFQNENICPICLMGMGLSTSKYSCINGHSVCHRCKPYYYSCPTCRLPLDIEVLPPSTPQDTEYHLPPSIHQLPHPYPFNPTSYEPSAPFISAERNQWTTPSSSPAEDQELFPCSFAHYGCYAQVPEYLKQLHESRCQFRPHLEAEQLPTDLTGDEGALQDCKYNTVGCNVRLPEWRKVVHEKLCIFKDRLDELNDLQGGIDAINFNDDNDDDGDPEEMMDCKYQDFGCQVRMPRRKKHSHEQHCNYAQHEEDTASDGDPDELVPCCWADYGCQVQPRRCRKSIHESKCNHRRVPCANAENGCSELVEVAKRWQHERSCYYS